MHHLGSIRREHGAALVISLLLLVVLFVVGSETLTTSRIETQIASNDTTGKQVLLAAEYALAVGENTVQQAWSEGDLADKLTRLSGRLYGKQQQPAWASCVWDDRDSIDVTAYFTDPIHALSLPQMFRAGVRKEPWLNDCLSTELSCWDSCCWVAPWGLLRHQLRHHHSYLCETGELAPLIRSKA